MLVLTRKAKQQIRLGDDIIVTVLQVKGNAIRLGIEAPRETRIIRGELDFFEDEPPKAKRSAQGKGVKASTFPIRDTATSASKTKSDAGETQVSGPTRLKIRTNGSTSTCFPSAMKLASENAPEARPLKKFMPKSMIDVVGNVSV